MAASSAPAPRRLRLRWLLPALALAAAAALASAGRPAGAHALLVRADPPVNAQLREPPTELTLYFSEPLERKLSGARVVDQNGERVDERVEFDAADEAALHVFLKPLSPGYVTILWETVSTVDGHRVSGSYPLTLLNPDGSVPAGRPVAAGTQVAGTGAKPERVAAKALLLAGGSLLAGAFAFIAYVTPGLAGAAGERARRAMDRRAVIVAGGALVVLAGAGAAELLLQASNVDVGVGDALDTRWGGRWLLRNLALLVPILSLLALLLVPLYARRLLAAAGLAGAGAYLGLTASVSHSAAGGGAFWAASSDFVHLLAASVWTGMLALLGLLFVWARGGLAGNEKYPVLAAALQRFSTVALASVALLLATGALNAVIEVGRVGDLVDTGYGRALLVKLLLIVPLLAVAAVNAYLFRPGLVEEAEAPARQRSLPALADLEARLARTVRWELALAAAVLVTVAVLVQLTPTRGRLAAPGQGAGKYTETREAAGVSVTLVVDPNQPGINTFEVYLTGAVDTVERVRLDFSQPGRGAGDARLVLDATNPPTLYVGRGPYLAQAGDWRVSVNLRRSVGNDLDLPFSVSVAGPGATTSAARSGGAFDSPVSLDAWQAALLAAVLLLCIGLVAGSVRPAGIVGGHLSLLAEAVSERIAVPRLRPAFSLALLLAVGIGLGAIVGSHIHTGAKDAGENPVPSSPDSIARGEMLFLQNCSQCHGETGRGDGPIAKSLSLPPANLYDHVPYHPDDFFFGAITNGLGGAMPAFKSQLSEEDRWHILNFLRDRFGKPPPTQ